MAHTFNWSLGHEGKGNVYPNGDISTWNINEVEEPHHDQQAAMDNQDYPAWRFHITPEGGLHDGGIGHRGQTPYTDDQHAAEVIAQHPAIYDARNEELEASSGGYGHAYNLMDAISKVASEEGWADFHAELKLPRGVRREVRKWADKLDWPEGSKKDDQRSYHITILSMDEYDEGFAKWMRKQIRGREFHFKSTGMDIFGDEHVVLRLESPEWTRLVESWTKIADKKGLEPHKFDPPKAHITIGKSPNGWPQGVPDPHIEFDTRMFNINKNSAQHLSVPVGPDWSEEQPMWYHGTDPVYAQRILQEGLKPWDSPDVTQKWGNPYEYEWWEPRPGHVYLTNNLNNARGHAMSRDTAGQRHLDHPGVVLQIDPKYLDPRNINPDEDSAQMANEEWAEDRHPQLPNSLGEWAEDNNYGNEPLATEHILDKTGVMAHRGIIPPEAISVHSEFVPGKGWKEPQPMTMAAKTSMAADPAWLDEYIQKNGPHLYHITKPEHVPSILEHGLLPWDALDGKGTPTDHPDHLQPRPGHTYLRQVTPSTFERRMDEQPGLLKVDLRKLDPQLMNPDEDSMKLNGPGWMNDWQNLGEKAEVEGYEDPADTARSLEKGKQTLAYRGAIPPEAIEAPNYSMGMYPSVYASSEQTVTDELKQWLDSFAVEQGGPPSIHHNSPEDFQPQVQEPVATQPFVDPPSHPYQPYDWATDGWEESPLDRTAASEDEELYVPGMQQQPITVEDYDPFEEQGFRRPFLYDPHKRHVILGGHGMEHNDFNEMWPEWWRNPNILQGDIWNSHEVRGQGFEPSIPDDLVDTLQNHTGIPLNREGGHTAASPEEEMFVPGMARQPLTINPIGWPQTSAKPHLWNWQPAGHEPSRTPFLYNRDTRTIHIGRPGMIHGDMYDAVGIPSQGDVGGEWSQGELKHHPADFTDEPSWFTYGDPRKADPERDEIYAAVQQHVGEPLRDIDMEHMQRSSVVDTHPCPQCGEAIDSSICGHCGYNPQHANSDYERAKNEWYEEAWSEPGQQARPVPQQQMHWRDDSAHDIKFSTENQRVLGSGHEDNTGTAGIGFETRPHPLPRPPRHGIQSGIGNVEALAKDSRPQSWQNGHGWCVIT